MSEGPAVTGYEEERLLLKRYLSDEIAPMIFADSASELFEVPAQVAAHEIHSWLGDQIRGASNMTPSDLLYHAASKLHQLGILELIPQEDVAQFLEKLRPFLIELCPAEQRFGFEEKLNLLERSTGMAGGKVEVLQKKGGPGAGMGGGVAIPAGHVVVPAGSAAAGGGQVGVSGAPTGGTAAPGGQGGVPQGAAGGPVGTAGVAVPTTTGGAGASAADALALHRVNLMLDQLQRVAIRGASSETGASDVNQRAVLGHVVEQFASQARNSKELEAQLGYLNDIGIENLGEELFRHLSKGLPDWAPPSHEDVGEKELPTGATRAMRKVVNLSEDSEELLARFREMVSVAIEEFNSGSLGRAVTLLDLAERMIDQGEVDATTATTVARGSFPEIDFDLVAETADDPDKRLLLHRLMRFFPKLRVTQLLEDLKDETDREKRLQLTKLLRAHGDEARDVAVEMLEESLNGEPRLPWHVERVLVYLMKAIRRTDDDTVDHEIDLLIRASDLGGSIPLVREAIATLVQLDHPRAYTALAARVSDIEDVMTGDSEFTVDAKEIRWLLSNAIKLLSQSESDEARSIVVGHGLRDKPGLGDTFARLVTLGHYDLSNTPEQLNRLLDAIQKELPRKFLGVSVKNQRKAQILEYLIAAVSGSNSPEVHTVLGDVIRQFPDQPFAQAANDALAKMGQPAPKPRKAPDADDSVTLSGDLTLFGLPGVLQNLSDAGVTGAVKILDVGGEELAEVHLAEGNMITAKAGQLSDDIAVYQLLERPIEGRFVFVNQELTEEDDSPKQGSMMGTMSLLLEGMRRYDEFNRALALVPDAARFKSTGKKPTDVKEDADKKLAKEVWSRAANGVSPLDCEREIPLDCFRIRRLYEHWVTEGSLALIDATTGDASVPPEED